MEFIQPMAAVVLVLALLCGALWVLKRRGGASFHLTGMLRNPAREMEVVERVALSGQHALHLVRVGEQSFVVSTSPSSCELVVEVDR